MGNYSELKTAISNIIKTNGNQEITGQLLQNALNNIVSTLGKGATFAGNASPSTEPGAPDQNLFYIAGIPGVYANFGGAEVTDEVLVFNNHAGVWYSFKIGIPAASTVYKKITEVKDSISQKSFGVKQRIEYSGWSMTGNYGDITSNLPENLNGFILQVSENSNYAFLGLRHDYPSIACYSKNPIGGDGAQSVFLGLAEVNNNTFTTLPNTNYVVTAAINTEDFPLDGEYYLLRNDEVTNLDLINKGALKFIAGLETVLDSEFFSGQLISIYQSTIFFNMSQKNVMAKKVNAVLYKKGKGSMNFWLLEVNNNAVTRLKLLATSDDDGLIEGELGVVSIPYTELKDNQYIGVNGYITYRNASAHGYSYGNIKLLGDEITGIQEDSVIGYMPIDIDSAIYKYVAQIKSADFLEELIRSQLGKTFTISVNKNSSFVTEVSSNAAIAIKFNDLSSDIKNIGLLTSSNWNYPVIWQTLRPKNDVWYYAFVKDLVFENENENPLQEKYKVFLNVYETDIDISGTATIIVFDNQSQQSARKKVASELYKKTFGSTYDSSFVGAPQGNFTENGLVVDTTAVQFNRYYSLSARTVRYLCAFANNTVAKFYTDKQDTVIQLDVPNKKVQINAYEYEAGNINGSDPILIEISKIYNKIQVKITNIYSSEDVNIELVYSGTGGVGSGVVSPESNAVGMQHDYYCFAKISGDNFLIKQMAIVPLIPNPRVIMYGDSITEPEGYFPSEDFANAWTQLVIKEANGKAVSSGRGGTTIHQLLERIQNELPYINAEYVMVTIGTNGGNTEANLSTLVEYIIGQGSKPILNNIPCNESGTQISVNSVIETVRAKYNIKGCKFDLATSVNMDGQAVDTTKMWWENYSSSNNIYHHPNVKGSKAMFARLKIDVPEIFITEP